MSKKIVAVFISLTIGLSAHGADRSGFSFKTGLGYDFLSQRYFLDSLQYVGSDSVLTRWALTTDYLDDVKGSLEFRYRYDDARRLDVRASYEQTPDLFRLKVSNEWEEELVIGNLRWRNEVDWRQRYRDSDRAVGSYLYGLSVARVKYPVTLSTDLWTQVQLDGVDFYDQQTLGFDHYRYGIKAGLERSFGIFSTASLGLFLMNRQVSDSGYLDYQSYGAEGSFLGAFARQDLDLLARFEHKNYHRPDNDEDFDRVDVDMINRMEMGENFVSRQELHLELAWFDPSDLLNLNYRRAGVTLLGGAQYGALEIGIGPDFEVLYEQSSDTSLKQDYYEMGGRLDLTVFSGKGLFGSADSELGYRHYAYQNDIQTNFVYYRLGVLADWTFFQVLNYNVVLSTEWEWHGDVGTDSRVMLLSSSLSYSF